MSDYTTDELIKANRVHADLHAGCQECPLYEERVCTSPNLETYSAECLESQKKEISDLKKQIADYDLNGQIRARDESLKRRKERNVLLEEEIEKLKWDNAALEATVENQRKQIAETYTAEQYRIDCQRMCESYPLCTGCPSLNECGDHHAWIVSSKTAREWALSHPEKPKVTNCDKLIEVFGDEASGIVASNSWLKAEYKEPSDK